jgi:queuine tRNA-ribosyltransferase
MPQALFDFQLLHVDSGCRARRARLYTPHGLVETPAFMPVGTAGSVKAMTAEMLAATGSQMILGNTYHLALRPGAETVAALGGLHTFMGWPGPILTDSGGFQLYSLAQNTRVTESAAVFRSHIDGQPLELSPERAIGIQELLGSDVAMVLDHVVPLPSSAEVVREACERTVRWAERSKRAATRRDQVQFAIVQGGLDTDLRAWCAAQLDQIGFPGYAIGGLSVGEGEFERHRILDVTCSVLPPDKPRYLMGVGTPQDILQAIACGVDMFDCVLPTRNGRNAYAFTDEGPLRLRNAVHQVDLRPLEANCNCPACRTHSRAYLRHLFMSDEMLGPILLTAHNLTYYQRLMAEVREAIESDQFAGFLQRKLRGWDGENASAGVHSPC